MRIRGVCSVRGVDVFMIEAWFAAIVRGHVGSLQGDFTFPGRMYRTPQMHQDSVGLGARAFRRTESTRHAPDRSDESATTCSISEQSPPPDRASPTAHFRMARDQGTYGKKCDTHARNRQDFSRSTGDCGGRGWRWVGCRDCQARRKCATWVEGRGGEWGRVSGQ